MMKTLFRKEFLSYFRSNTAYFIIAVYAVLSMVVTFYAAYFFQINNESMFSFFYLQPQILALITPAITMRLWAEEKKSGTYEFLLTQPVSHVNIVISKFLAAVVFCLLMIVVSFPLLVYTAYVIEMDVLNIFANYLALVCILITFSAVGCMVSSFNKSAIIAYLISAVLCWFMSFIDTNYYEMLQGEVGLDNIIYFAGITFFAILINISNLKTKKENIFITLVLTVTALILINICAFILFGKYKLDLTDDRKYTLSQGSKNIIKNVSEPVYIKLYVSDNLAKDRYKDYIVRFLKQYKSSNIKLDVINVEPYSLQEKESKDIGIEPYPYLGASFQTIDNEIVVPNFKALMNPENEVSRIIYKLSRQKNEFVGMIAPQKAYSQNFISELETNYRIVPISPDIKEIPDGLTTLILINPRGLSSFSTYAVENFLLRGGRVLVFLDAFSENKANIKSTVKIPNASITEMLKNMGVEVFYEVVAGDKNLSEKALINNKITDFYPWVNPIINQENPITKGISKLNLNSPAVIALDPYYEISVTSLFRGSDGSGMMSYEAFVDEDKSAINSLFISSDEALDFGVLLEGKFNARFPQSGLLNSIEPFKMIIAADSDMLFDENTIDNNNIDFLIRSVDYLTGNVDLLQIPVKKIKTTEPISFILNEEISKEYKEEYENLQNGIFNKKKELEQIDSKNYSLSVSQNISKLEEEIKNLIEETQFVDYKIEQKLNHKINFIILLNTVVFPFIFIIFVFGIYSLRRKNYA